MSTESAKRFVTCAEDIPEHLVPVVLGGDILAYAYVRCFHDAYGLRSTVLASADIKAVSTSRFCDFSVVDGIDREDSLISYLSKLGERLTSEGKLGLLVGSGDWYARILSQHKAELERWFVVPYIDFDLLDRITQKEQFYAICEELGIPYPKTWEFDCADPDATIDVSQFTYPLIAKPSNTARYHYAKFANKKKAYEIQEPEELSTLFDRLKASSYDKELLVQDFIPGDDDCIYTVTIYGDEHGEPRVTCAGRVVLQDHAPSALGDLVCIISERPEPAIADACKFMRHVGYHGFAQFDIKYDERDGSYKFFEINTRPGRSTYYVVLSGLNFVEPIVEDFVLGHEVPVSAPANPFLYACIPSMVVSKTVEKPELRDRVLKMYHDGLACFPLQNPADTPAHRFWAWVNYYHQISKFKKYVWDTNGRQADEG